MLNYILRPFDNSSMVTTSIGVRWSDTPSIVWSEDYATAEKQALVNSFPVQMYPMFSPNKTKTNLKLITGDGIYKTVPSAFMYTQEFSAAVWLGLAGSSILIPAFIGVVSELDGGQASKGRSWTLFSTYAALLDQVVQWSVPRRWKTARTIVPRLAVLLLPCASVLNNQN